MLEHVVLARVEHAIPGRAGPDTETDREVALADTGRAEKEDRFAAVQKPKLGQAGLLDAPVGRGLGPGEDLVFDDPCQEAEVTELELRGFAQQSVEMVG